MQACSAIQYTLNTSSLNVPGVAALVQASEP
jgi:hypothetical protein